MSAELDNLPGDYLDIFLKSSSFLDHCNIVLFYETMSKFRRKLSYFYKIPCLIVFFTSLTVYLIKILNEKIDIGALAQTVSVYAVCVQNIYRAVVLTSKKEEIKALILRLGTIWRTDLSPEQVMKKNALLKGLNFRSAATRILIVYGSWQYMLMPLLDLLFRRYILRQECEMQLPVDCVFPFDPTKNWFRYIAIYVFETYCIFHAVYCYFGSDNILIILSSHISTEFVLLQNDLENLQPEEDIDAVDEINIERRGSSVQDLIRRHQELIKLSQDLDDIFNRIIFMNLTCATIMISFFLLAIIVANGTFDLMKNFLAIFSGTYPIYNVCYHAQFLKDSSEALGDSVYQSQWYKGNKKHQFLVWFIIKRSQTPCFLTSMKYNKIALTTFKTVMSTTWSYFSLASSITEE